MQVDWIDLLQDREQRRTFVNELMNLWVPWNVGTFWSSYTTGGFSRRAHFHLVSYTNYDKQHGIRSTWKVGKIIVLDVS
jgi:hypothetical protein